MTADLFVLLGCVVLALMINRLLQTPVVASHLSASQEVHLWLLMRGTAATHEQHPFRPKPGNFTLVTDRPELRYHDGVTPGGVVVALPQAVWADVREHYRKAGCSGCN